MPWIILLAIFFGGVLLLTRSAPGGWRRWVGQSPAALALAACELVLIGVLLARAPEFRRPYGLALITVGMGLIHWRAGQALGIFKSDSRRLPPAGPRGSVALLPASAERPRRKVMDPAGPRRYLYLALAVIYFVVISLVLLIRIYTGR